MEEFWGLHAHLVPSTEIIAVVDYALFTPPVRPLWEDAGNRLGGKWMLRVKKGLSARFWEHLLLALIGEQVRRRRRRRRRQHPD